MKKYIIDELQLWELLQASETLAHLEMNGINNWEFYEEVLNNFNYNDINLDDHFKQYKGD